MAQTLAEKWLSDSMSESLSDSNNSNNSKQCYIKRNDEWQKARLHHYLAYNEYLNTINKRHGQLIEVPHAEGGDFVAWFFETSVKGVFRFHDQYDNEVFIKME